MPQLDPQLYLAREVLLPEIRLIMIRDALPELQQLVRVQGEADPSSLGPMSSAAKDPPQHLLGRAE